MSRKKRILLVATILLALALFVGRPLMTRLEVGGHSAYVDLIRSIAWHNQVLQDRFYPRWMPDFYMGHGSPIFLFYAPASYVFIELMRPLAHSTTGAIKLAYFLWIWLAMTGMYALGKRLSTWQGGLAAAAAYGLAPTFWWTFTCAMGPRNSPLLQRCRGCSIRLSVARKPAKAGTWRAFRFCWRF
jgi:hypothetical protein